MIGKNVRILALVLALVMVFSSTVFAAEGDHFIKADGEPAYSANQVRADVVAKNHVRSLPGLFQIEVGGKLYDLAAANAAFNQDKENWKDILTSETDELEVVEVSAITANYVTVAITAPAEDMLAQEVEVKNGAGVVVPVKPLDIAAGDKTAEFEFVTAVKAADLKGVWTVNGKSYDLDLFNKLSDFLAATDQLKLNAALIALGIENVDTANMPAYFTEQQKLTVSAEELTVADVQKLVDDVNATAISAEDEAAIVKAVTDAKTAGNAITLLQTLQNKAFVRVNPDWVTTATNGYMTKIVGTETTIAAIQTVINNSNDTIIKAEQVTTGIDKAKLNATQALIDAWATVDKDGKITDATIKTYPDLINIQLAVADVVAATTPTALKNKLTVLAGLDKANLDMKNYVDANGKAYITALGALADTAKDTTTEIAGVITATNTAEAGKLVTAVKTAASGTDADALLKALNDLGLKQVAASNKAAYLAENDFKTITDKAEGQTAVDKVNVAVLSTMTDADELLVALKVLELDNIVDANKDAYLAGKATLKTSAAAVKTAVQTINDAEEVEALVEIIKESTDVATTKQALIDLANLGKVTNFLATPAADRTFVAEELVAIVDRTTVDTEGKINTLIGTPINAKITAVVGAANAVTRADNADFAKVKLVLAKFKAYTDLGDLAKVDVQEAFYALLTFPEGSTTGTDKPVPAFTSYTGVKALVDEVIAAQ